MKRAFRELNAAEILALAIRVEENNAQRLQALVDMFTGYDARLEQFFRRLQMEELEHKRRLELEWRNRFGTDACPEVDEDDVLDIIEAVDVLDGEHLVFDDITPEVAVEIIRTAEQAAYLFYLKAATAVKELELKNLLSDLARLEFKHMENIPPPENDPR